jgi:putative flippase GtrA
MKIWNRLASFISVGVFATLVHASILVVITGSGHAAWIANPLGFLGGFLASFTLQQRLTFRDRLAGSVLTPQAGILIFMVNLVLSAVIAPLSGRFLIMLPLLPALVNYCLYFSLSGMPRFRRKPGRHTSHVGEVDRFNTQSSFTRQRPPRGELLP